jgi:LysM repeat protein
VIAGAAALAVTALSMALATTAQATHSGSATPGAGVTRVTVRAGQSLWSLARAYDPHADPRVTEEQIRQLNALPGYQVQAGAVLWVPRG